jgi:hypothetical protein
MFQHTKSIRKGLCRVTIFVDDYTRTAWFTHGFHSWLYNLVHTSIFIGSRFRRQVGCAHLYIFVYITSASIKLHKRSTT